MREIKFRAWDKLSKRIFYLDTFHDTLGFGRNGNAEYYNLQNGSGGKEYELMQYTGLKDKNGKEIYEGDILSCTWRDMPHSVVFDNGSFKLSDISAIVDDVECIDSKIIGNIFENPKLKS